MTTTKGGGFIDYNKIVPLAENADHHPDIFIHSYKKVRIELITHSKGQITEMDYQLAAEIDKID